jgi:hypothetical protein
LTIIRLRIVTSDQAILSIQTKTKTQRRFNEIRNEKVPYSDQHLTSQSIPNHGTNQKILLTMLEPTVAPAPKIAKVAVSLNLPKKNQPFAVTHTGIAQFLAKLLAPLLKLIRLGVIGLCTRRSTLADIQRHVSITCRRGR